MNFIKTSEALLLALTTCIVTPAFAAGLSGEPILIGVIGGTTGAYGNVGTQAQQGAFLARDKINAAGGVLGRPLVLDAVNDNADGTLAGQLFRKFVSEGAVAVVGSPDNGPVTAQLAERYHIVDSGIVDGGGLTVYPNGPDKPPLKWVYAAGNSFAWGEILGRYATEHCKKGLAVLHDTTSYGLSGLASIKGAYETANRKIALERPITENWTTGATAQLMPEIAQVKSSGADCIDVWLSPANQAAFVQDLQTSGDRGNYILLGNADTAADGTFSNLAGDSANGMIAALITAELHQNDLYKQFAADYRKQYNAEPTQAVEYTYQAIITLAHLIEKTKSTDRATLRDAMDNSAGFPGILGDAGFTATRHAAITGDDMTLVQYDSSSKKWVENH